jgi:predicted lipoprotein with Yx(FWY)xxD motif
MIALVLLMISCGDKDPVEQPDIKISTTTLGEVITDKDGMVLYYFSPDVGGDSKCSGNCLANWPAFSVDGVLKLAEGLDATAFSSITRTDGTKQVTYKGWPLYYFVNDEKAGDVNGEGLNGVWYVAKKGYTIMVASTQLVGNDGKSYKSDYTEGTGDTQFFTDEKGRTLYSFQNDRKEKNNFTREDFSNNTNWPIFTTEIGELPSTLNKSDFKVIDVFDRKQLTYKGWPLYYFGADNETRGSTKGVSVPVPGRWPVVNQDMASAPQ